MSLQSFLTEFHLVDTFRSILKTNLKFDSVTEIEGVNGIADVVLYRPANPDFEYINKLSLVHPSWAYALYALPLDKEFTASEFASMTGCSKRTAQDALFSYMGASFCHYDAGSNAWKKIRQPQKIAEELFAVEAKLKDWKRALKQAYRYLDYANQAWVLMDQVHSKPAIQNIDSFRRLNVGLATMSTSGELNLIFHPRKSLGRSEISVWAAHAAIAQKVLY